MAWVGVLVLVLEAEPRGWPHVHSHPGPSHNLPWLYLVEPSGLSTPCPKKKPSYTLNRSLLLGHYDPGLTANPGPQPPPLIQDPGPTTCPTVLSVKG